MTGTKSMTGMKFEQKKYHQTFYFNFPDLSNPDSQTAKALRVLPALTFKI